MPTAEVAAAVEVVDLPVAVEVEAFTVEVAAEVVDLPVEVEAFTVAAEVVDLPVEVQLFTEEDSMVVEWPRHV